MGIGNTLRSDDGIGSLLAGRLKGKLPCIVYDSGTSPENYLGKIIKDRPGSIIIIDAVDFGGKPGEFRELEPQDLKSVNLCSTHNASLELAINYLQSNLTADIIILMIQPGSLAFGDKLSPQAGAALERLEDWFGEAAQKT